MTCDIFIWFLFFLWRKKNFLVRNWPSGIDIRSSLIGPWSSSGNMNSPVGLYDIALKGQCAQLFHTFLQLHSAKKISYVNIPFCSIIFYSYFNYLKVLENLWKKTEYVLQQFKILTCVIFVQCMEVGSVQYDPVCKRAWSYTFMLLSEHLF